MLKKPRVRLYLSGKAVLLAGLSLIVALIVLTAATCSPAPLTGAGATFPYPLYSKWFDEYTKIEPALRINYQSIGSGAGIRQIIKRTVDFGASDVPMSDEQLTATWGNILHIPTALGGVVVVYNLPGIGEGLKLTPGVLAGIFLGDIARWNDGQITALNRELILPDRDIVVVHRSDGSGTTSIFTDYLSAVSPAWKSKVGKGTAVNWPAGIGQKGNEGVTGQVEQLTGSIGYVELAYAVQNRLPYAYLQNQAGNFIKPALPGLTAAAATAAIPEDLRVSIVNAPGAEAYPIAAYTYILVYQEQSDPVKGAALARFLWWAIHQGQSYASSLLYAPLPSEVVTSVELKISSLQHRGQYLLTVDRAG